MRDSNDRRKAKRVALFDEFPVLDSRSGDSVGYIRDISSNGCRIGGEWSAMVDHTYQLAIVFPEPIVGEKVLKLEATCRWHTYNASRGYHEAGFQFGKLAMLEAYLLQQIETEYEFCVSESGH